MKSDTTRARRSPSTDVYHNRFGFLVKTLIFPVPPLFSLSRCPNKVTQGSSVSEDPQASTALTCCSG